MEQTIELPKKIEVQEINREVGKINYQIFKSHLTKILLKIVITISLSLLLITTNFFSTTLSLTIIFLLCILLGLNIKSNYKKILFEISFLYTVKTGGYDWWTPITDKITLGALPLENHGERLRKSQVSHVLTLLEPFELVAGLIQPLSPKFLEAYGIKNKIIPTQDFLGVSPQTIHEAVEHIHEIIDQQDHRIYIHCKAGRGRSPTVVIAYLLKYGYQDQKFKNFKEAYAFVKNRRPQINLKGNQQKTIEAYYSQYVLNQH